MGESLQARDSCGMASVDRWGLSCKTPSRHCKTYNFLHRILLLLNCSGEWWEAICLSRANALLF